MLITNSEIAMLNRAGSEYEWNVACDAIKGARDGQYPDDWYAKVRLGGIMVDFERRTNRK